MPVLIAALDETQKLAYRDPPQPAFRFARAELLFFTTQDFGLRASTDAATAVSSKPGWLAWWQTNQAVLRFDAKTMRFTP